eukprot:TRINITY_DN4401_c0_g1_i8.p1 TRINITY_DN4401_c0_g1~~TRINITY_DN4401_c0_g1_i8.p1  ORF type:complete len:291 (+),score=-26.24 TRINITY_DN4401_c0_g1_i8:419-1291(+)
MPTFGNKQIFKNLLFLGNKQINQYYTKTNETKYISNKILSRIYQMQLKPYSEKVQGFLILFCQYLLRKYVCIGLFGPQLTSISNFYIKTQKIKIQINVPELAHRTFQKILTSQFIKKCKSSNQEYKISSQSTLPGKFIHPPFQASTRIMMQNTYKSKLRYTNVIKKFHIYQPLRKQPQSFAQFLNKLFSKPKRKTQMNIKNFYLYLLVYFILYKYKTLAKQHTLCISQIMQDLYITVQTNFNEQDKPHTNKVMQFLATYKVSTETQCDKTYDICNLKYVGAPIKTNHISR